MTTEWTIACGTENFFFIVLLPTIPICSKVNVNINLEQGVETGGCMDGHAPNVEISLHDPFLNFW